MNNDTKRSRPSVTKPGALQRLFLDRDFLLGWVTVARFILLIGLASACLAMLTTLGVLDELLEQANGFMDSRDSVVHEVAEGLPWLTFLWWVGIVLSALLFVIAVSPPYKGDRAEYWIARNRLVAQWFLALTLLFAFSSADLGVVQSLQGLPQHLGWPLLAFAVVSVGIFQLVHLRLKDDGTVRKG